MARTFPKMRMKQVPVKKRLEWLISQLDAGVYDAGNASYGRRLAWENYKKVFLRPACNYYCYVCNKKSAHWHHIVQICRGGEDSKFNLVCLCLVCHKKIHRHDTVRRNRASAKMKVFVSPLVKPAEAFVYVPPKHVYDQTSV